MEQLKAAARQAMQDTCVLLILGYTHRMPDQDRAELETEDDPSQPVGHLD